MDAGASSTLLSSSSSYQDIHAHDSSTDDIDSLPSTSASSTSISPSEDDLNDAEREWRESLQQLELILTMVLIPFVGKYFGRKTAYWGQFSALSRLGQVTLRTLVLTIMCRLGKVHGVVVPRSRRDHEQGLVQSRRHRRGRSRAVDIRPYPEDNEPKASRGQRFEYGSNPIDMDALRPQSLRLDERPRAEVQGPDMTCSGPPRGSHVSPK